MSARDYRKKASEVHAEATYVFSQKVSFAEAFPEIDDVTVEVERDGQRQTYQKRYLGEYIDCDKPLCYRGGFSIGEVLREMVRERSTERQGGALCRGNEGSPKGRRVYRKCVMYFRYKVSVTYGNLDTDSGSPRNLPSG